MKPLSEADIRGSFVNCSKGEASRINLPPKPAELPWPELEFLGWRDSRAEQRAYIVSPGDGRPVGIVLRAPSGTKRSSMRASMCMLCLTTHTSSGVGMFAAPKAGAAGRRDNTIGLYICADLACSLYLRGKRRPEVVQIGETLDVEDRLTRLRLNLDAFVKHVLLG
jgi:hypothetical protein